MDDLEGPIDAEVVPYEAPQTPASLFGTNDPVQIVEKASEIASALKDVIDKKGLASKIQGKEHVRVEGWQLLGSMLGISAICVHTEKTDEDGNSGYKATVEARRMDGTVVGRADALCTRAENQWKKRDDYALLSMSQTRAVSKALRGPLGFVVSLAGYSATPAEEVGDVPTNLTQPAPEIEWGDDPKLAQELKAGFKALGFTKGKVRMLMGGCQSHEDRQKLLSDLEAQMPGAPA